MVPLLALAVAGILSGKDLRSLAVVAVVAQTMAQEPRFITIVVLVDEVGLLCFHSLPAILKAVCVVGYVFWYRTTGTYYLDIWIFLADGLDERLQALVIELVPLLVAYSDILHVKRCWMTHLGTDLSPLGVCGTIGKLDEV